MSPDVGHPSLVEMAHLEATFHATDEPLYLGTGSILQLETVAELWIVPINLGKHLAWDSVGSALVSIGTTFCLLVTRALL